MDVKLVFLNDFLNKEIHTKQPFGYERKDHEKQVYKLKKALYGLKHEPCARCP